METETDSRIPFLDTLIKRNDDGSIFILVYRKPTHTDQYLNFHSNHQISSKESVASPLFTRADNIISEPTDLRTENDRIIKVLTDNDYSKQIIGKVRRNIEKLNHNNIQDKEDKEYVGYINLQYIAGTSEILRRIFQKHKFRCTFYSSDTLRKTLSNPKDKIEKVKQNNIVYIKFLLETVLQDT